MSVELTIPQMNFALSDGGQEVVALLRDSATTQARNRRGTSLLRLRTPSAGRRCVVVEPIRIIRCLPNIPVLLAPKVVPELKGDIARLFFREFINRLLCVGHDDAVR